MKRLIIGTLEVFSHGLIILFLLAGLVLGYEAGDLIGAVVGLVTAFLLSVMIFGFLFIALDMSETLHEILKLLQNRKPTAAQATPALATSPASSTRRETTTPTAPGATPAPTEAAGPAVSREPYPYSVRIGDTEIRHNNREFVVGDKKFSSLEEAKAYLQAGT